MGRNLTQPEEIDHILLEMAGPDMRTDTPDYRLNIGFALTGSLQQARDKHIEFVGVAPADK